MATRSPGCEGQHGWVIALAAFSSVKWGVMPLMGPINGPLNKACGAGGGLCTDHFSGVFVRELVHATALQWAGAVRLGRHVMGTGILVLLRCN